MYEIRLFGNKTVIVSEIHTSLDFRHCIIYLQRNFFSNYNLTNLFSMMFPYRDYRQRVLGHHPLDWAQLLQTLVSLHERQQQESWRPQQDLENIQQVSENWILDIKQVSGLNQSEFLTFAHA